MLAQLAGAPQPLGDSRLRITTSTSITFQLLLTFKNQYSFYVANILKAMGFPFGGFWGLSGNIKSRNIFKVAI